MKELFNGDWKFRLAEVGSDYTDADWSDVEIPHDWLIYNTSELYQTGEGWYKKDFNVLADELNLVYTVIFDGVYMDSAIFVNGQLAGEWKYGYTSFHFNISRFLKEGNNTITVRVRHEAPNTRWYSGAGIYRNVWLNKQGKTRIINDGVYISAKQINGAWELCAQTELEGEADLIRHSLIGADGNLVKTFESDNITLDNVNIWALENPYVYKLKTELIKDNAVVDTEINPVGFRTLEFSPDRGFFLNGRYLKMHGVCLHHDLGALGAAFDTGASRRQLEIMQEMGVNAIRVSHNPPAREFLDLCDEMGLLVIDEAFDIWELPKNKNDYARFFPEWHKRDVASWVRRDRNHPSVIMWSIGNEIYDTHKDGRGLEVAKILRDEVLKHDPRQNAQVTIASNFMPFENAQRVSDEIKLAGYNYAENLYDSHHEKYPDWFIYGSETASAVRSRGVYRFPVESPLLTFEDRQCSDLGNSVVGWGIASEKAWILDRDRTWCGGQFIWTGIDYIGEPTPYSTKNSYFGAVDTAGLPKAIFYFYKSVWNKKTLPFIKLFPHWDWNEGQIIDVIAYSNVAEAELFLNNKSFGRQKIDHEKGNILHFHWKVPFEKGELLIKAYDQNGEIVASDKKVSFGEVVRIECEAKTFEDTHFIRLFAVDENGVLVENARNRVYVEALDQNTKLLGIDNGDSTDFDSYKGSDKRLFGGQLVVITKGGTNIGLSHDSGEIPLRKIELTADRLILDENNKKAKISLRVLPENADDCDIVWKCVLDTDAVSEIAVIDGDNSGAVIEAKGDGCFKIRATCNNGKDHPEIISELDFTAEGLGEMVKNPFAFISASLYDISYAPLKIIERGSVAGVNKERTLIGFKNLNFAKVKTDLLRLYIGTTNYFDEIPVEIHVGIGAPQETNFSGSDTRLIETVNFPRNNLHYDFAPFDFKLSEKLSGTLDISFIVDRRCVFGGFEFLNESAFETIQACEKDEIYGDNYNVNNNRIEKIGNNVIINYNALGFGEKGADKIIISGFAPKGNSISLKLGDRKVLLEFNKSNDYIEQEFDIGEIKGLCDVSFVFLPGSDFNLEWFRFI